MGSSILEKPLITNFAELVFAIWALFIDYKCTIIKARLTAFPFTAVNVSKNIKTLLANSILVSLLLLPRRRTRGYPV